MPRYMLMKIACVVALCSTSGTAQTRVFMAPDGQEASVATSGPTTVAMTPGSTQTIVVWLEDTGSGQLLNNYQMVIRWLATPLAGASGEVMYVDDGGLGGNSVVIDTARADWVFAGDGANPPVYSEADPVSFPTGSGFGAIGSRIGLNDGSSAAGLHYLLEFDVIASADACDQHRLDIVDSGLAPSGGTSLGQPGGLTPFTVDEFQDLIIDLTPGNDACADAVVINDGVTPFDTRCTSTDGTAHPGTDCDNAGQDDLHNDVWFRYTASCTGTLRASTCGAADFDTRIAIYDGAATCPPESADLLGCNDDGMGCAGFTSVAEADVLSGDELLIRVGGFDASEIGMGDLDLFCEGVCLPGSEVPNSPDALAICGDPGACNQVFCDLSLGCVVEPLAAGTLCDDGNVCTLTDTCDGNGSCAGANVNPCNDFSPCTSDSCDPAVGGDGCLNVDINGQACVSDADCQSGTPTATCDLTLGLCECQSCNSFNCGLTNQLCLDLRNAGGPGFGICGEDSDCGPSPDGVLHCIDDDDNPLNGGTCLDQACYQSGDLITIDLELSPTTEPACGGQFFLGWDVSTLGFVDLVIDPDGEIEWSLVLVNEVDELAGTIDLVAGIPLGTACNAANGATSGGTIARLTFQPTSQCKSGGVFFRSNNPPTGVGGATGDIAIQGCNSELTPSNTDPIQIQSPPQWSCPASDFGNADCGGLTRDVNLTAPTLTDDCDAITAPATDLCTVQHFVPCAGDLDCGVDPSDLCATDAECDGSAGSCVASPSVEGFICDGNLPCTGFCRQDVCTAGYCSASATPAAEAATILGGGDVVLSPGRYLVDCAYTNGCGLTSTCSYDVVNTGLNTAIVDLELSPTLASGTLSDPIERCIELGLNICGAPGDPVLVSVPVIFGSPNDIPGHGTAVANVPAGNWDCLTARDPAHSLMASCLIECTADNVLYAEFKGPHAFGNTCHWLVQGNVDHDANIDIIDYTLVAAALFTLAPNGQNTPCGVTDIDADFNGDGLVTLEDLSFVVLHFDTAAKNPCEPLCDPGGGGSGGGDRNEQAPAPRSSITVAEMTERGYGAAADEADVNGDGVIDVADIRATVESRAERTELFDALDKQLRRIERAERRTKRPLRNRAE